MFSSPSGAFYFSIKNNLIKGVGKYVFSSPSGAFYFSICKKCPYSQECDKVFVPFRGFLFFYYTSEMRSKTRSYRFRPLPGLFIFL